jgi:diadenylate cyclase
MTEVTDTLVLVVSEETGQMSIVRNGTIFHNLSTQELRKKVNEYLYEDHSNAEEEVVEPPVKIKKKKKKSEESSSPEQSNPEVKSA